jgi:hypothetical protein
MEWLMNLLSSGGGSSPFGALGGGGALPGSTPVGQGGIGSDAVSGATSPAPPAPMQQGAPGLPGLLGGMLQKPQGQSNSGPLLNQAMSMLKPQQMQATQWMPWMNTGR